MRTDVGWAEFVDPERDEVVARGRISVYATELPSPISGPWQGDATLIRGHGELAGRARPFWVLRFEQGPQQRWVEVQTVRPFWAPSGLRASARITSYDEEFPSYAYELGGE